MGTGSLAGKCVNTGAIVDTVDGVDIELLFGEALILIFLSFVEPSAPSDFRFFDVLDVPARITLESISSLLMVTLDFVGFAPLADFWLLAFETGGGLEISA
jgi:hypothetical protein